MKIFIILVMHGKKLKNLDINDPYYKWTYDLVENLEKITQYEVITAFNQFNTPLLNEAIDQAVEKKAEKIIVISTMVNRGSNHAEVDIPEIIKKSQQKYPAIPIIYAYPFENMELAKFLGKQIFRFI